MRKKIQAVVKFDIKNFKKADMHRLLRVEILLEKLGIKFDTGTAIGEYREWFLDQSLSGPLSVESIDEKAETENE